MMQVIADIKVQDKGELYEKLDAAVAAAHTNALTNRRSGVLVTRHDFDHFSVSLSPNVPFGITQENDQARRN
jgi:hypothetical protein